MSKKAMKKEIGINSLMIDDLFKMFGQLGRALNESVRSLEKKDLETLNHLDELEIRIKRIEREVFNE